MKDDLTTSLTRDTLEPHSHTIIQSALSMNVVNVLNGHIVANGNKRPNGMKQIPVNNESTHNVEEPVTHNHH